MKKILLVLLLLMATNTLADSLPDDDEWAPTPCPTTPCPTGTFMGIDDKCYPCDTTRDIYPKCLGDKKMSDICPNRFTIVGGCVDGASVLSASDCEWLGISKVPRWADWLSFFVPFYRLRYKSTGIDYKHHVCYDDRDCVY